MLKNKTFGISLIILCFLQLAACKDFSSEKPLLDKKGIIFDEAAPGYWLASDSLTNQDSSFMDIKPCSKNDAFVYDPSKMLALNLIESLEHCSKESREFKRIEEQHKTEAIKLVGEYRSSYLTQASGQLAQDVEEYYVTALQRVFALDNGEGNVSEQDFEKARLEMFTLYSQFMSTLTEKMLADVKLVEHTKSLGEIPEVINEFPSGSLVQYRGDGLYQLTVSGDQTLTFSIHEHPSSGILQKNYIFQFNEDDGGVYYYFVSKPRLGDWAFWIQDKLTPRSLWQDRKFSTKTELIDFATGVFNGVGFMKETSVFEELDREDLVTLDNIKSCRKALVESKPTSLDALKSCKKS